MAARRPTRSSKPPASPSTSSSSHTDVDIDHLAGQMLATLGISKKSSIPSSSANNNVRTTRSSSKDALSALATASTTTPVMKSRTVSSTSNVTSASASSRSRMSSSEAHPHATPLTAIRRPVMQASSTSKRVPSSSATSLQKSPKTTNLTNNNNNNALSSSSSTAMRRKSSAPPPPVSITSEEYSSLVSLLAAKDAQIASLETSLQESEERVSTLSTRNKELEKEASIVAAQLIVSPYTAGITASGSRKALVGKAKNNDDTSNVSKREYEDMKKQYEMQENLLLGFQRENEKAMVEIETLKKRERSLVEQLKKVYGPTFSADMDLPSSPSNTLEGVLPTSSARNTLTSPLPAKTSPEKRELGQVDPQALMEQLLSVQNLVQRFEKRLISRETELIKLEEEARQKSRVAEELFMTAAA